MLPGKWIDLIIKFLEQGPVEVRVHERDRIMSWQLERLRRLKTFNTCLDEGRFLDGFIQLAILIIRARDWRKGNELFRIRLQMCSMSLSKSYLCRVQRL